MQMIGRYVGDWDERAKKVLPFLQNILATYQDPKILDLALGCGQDSIHLLKEGYHVFSNEVDEDAIKAATKNATKFSVNLNLCNYDWLEIDAASIPGRFDLIFGLGNSFPTYLSSIEEMKQALLRLWGILKPGGTLLFDTRAYDYILENRQAILSDPYLYHRYFVNYLNKEVVAVPTEITESKVSITYRDDSREEISDNLPMYPVTDKMVMEIIKDTLGNVSVEKFYDYQKDELGDFDFIEYVIKKQ